VRRAIDGRTDIKIYSHIMGATGYPILEVANGTKALGFPETKVV
jgi:hypothetical protein